MTQLKNLNKLNHNQMANWDNLNKEFDDAINGMTKDDFDLWIKNRKENRYKRLNKIIMKSLQVKEKIHQQNQSSK